MPELTGYDEEAPAMPPEMLDEQAATVPAGPISDLPEYQPGQNLVEAIEAKNPEFLEHLGRRVCENAEKDYNSSEKYRKKREKHVLMFSGEVPGKIGDNQENITYVHLPYMTKVILQFHAKYQVSFFPASGDFVGAHSDLPGDQERMMKLTRHLNLQLTKEITEYVPEQDQGGISWLLFGSVFDVWYWDDIEKRAKTEFISSDDCIVPYSEKFRSHDMGHLPRITWRKFMYRWEIEALTDSGWFQDRLDVLFPESGNSDESLPPPSDMPSTTQNQVRDAVDKRMGVSRSADDDDAPREIYECDTKMRLPGLNRQRPITVIVDKARAKVLRIHIREKDDPKDKQRHLREVAERDATVARLETETEIRFAQAMEAHQSALAEYQNAVVTGTIDPMVTPQPMPPERTPADLSQLPEAAPIKRVPWNRFTHYGCIPNPEGFYQYGLGMLIEGYNIVADDVMSRFISAYTMAILRTVIYSRDVKAPRGDFELKLGSANEVALPWNQVASAFHELGHQMPDASAFQFEQRMSQAVQEITADDIVGGAAGKSGETATTTEIRASNAIDNIATIGARFTRARTASLQNLVYINSQTLPAQNISAGQDNKAERYDVTADDYIQTFDVVFTADPNFASRPQKQSQAEKILNKVLQIPSDIFQDPTPLGQAIQEAAANFLDTMERPDIAKLIRSAKVGPPQPQGAPPDGNGQPGDVASQRPNGEGGGGDQGGNSEAA